MDRDRVLGAVSAIQLAVGIAGLALALRRQRAFDVPMLRGRPENVVRDSIFVGTALSAPVTMLSAQGVATVRVLRGGTDRDRRILGGLGAIMTAGYLAERLGRRRLRPSGWDPVESPVVVLGITTAVLMVGLGLSSRPGRP